VYESVVVARAAVKMALSESRDEERRLKELYAPQGIRVAAVDFGGRFQEQIPRVVEHSVVAAKREGAIRSDHPHEGAVAGAAREALAQVAGRALGLNVGGKVGVARSGEHLVVAVFAGIGLVHLDDCAIAVAHRAVPA